ncbi:hypothetical protein Tco_0859705 [Tanacetum coccineum]|uniref:Uncharacterized protein n=1 Tax=Tanacetum coccineum TaxID=301880 RepID=A0ABQ5BGM9_9ASTR
MPAVPPPSVYEVGGPSTAAVEGQSFPLPAPRLPIPQSVIEDLSSLLGNLLYEHGQLGEKVIQVSNAKVDSWCYYRGEWPRVVAIEGQQVMAQGCNRESFTDSTLQTTILGNEQPGRAHYVRCIWGGQASGRRKYFYHATDSYASNPTHTDCMERVSCESLCPIRPERKIPTVLFGMNLSYQGCKSNTDTEKGSLWRCKDSQGGWKLRRIVPRLKMRNGEDFSYIRYVFPMMYQLMAVKKTSFPEMECGGSIVVNIPGIVEDYNKALSGS